MVCNCCLYDPLCSLYMPFLSCVKQPLNPSQASGVLRTACTAFLRTQLPEDARSLVDEAALTGQHPVVALQGGQWGCGPFTVKVNASEMTEMQQDFTFAAPTTARCDTADHGGGAVCAQQHMP